AVSVPLKFQREGIRYDDLSDEDKDQWDALEWDEDGQVPDRVEAEAVNRWLFNQDTVDKVLAHLMTRGLKVAGGDRLGKTILFAKNQAHAEFIAERFNANFPHWKGEFARVITFKTEYAQTLIESFSLKERTPHIALSVDMLDTGIDVPEVVNLVFFKLVRSKTKFWQMLGRGTRLCPDLFGPGEDKKCFYLFDYCQNLEYFSQNPETIEGASGDSLGKRLFTARLDLIGELDRLAAAEGGEVTLREPEATWSDPRTGVELRQVVGALLQAEVAAMSLDNFVVRPHRRTVERFARPEAWTALSVEARIELATEVAGLPSERGAEIEEAKRFDLLLLHLQLARLRSDPGFERLRERVQQIAGLLEEKSAIPMVREQMLLIQDLQTDEWWQDVTAPMLEVVRRRLRELVAFIEKRQRKSIYTNFEDELGSEAEFVLPGLGEGADFAKFRAKALAFLRAHLDHVAIHKLRTNRALTATDLAALEQMLVENGVGAAGEIGRAKVESQGLGLFVRSLIGLDREAAKAAMGGFLNGKSWSATQIEFVNLIVNHLTEHGVMEAARLYESPFTDLTPRGPEGLFSSNQVDALLAALTTVRANALAA
ncbi:MAG: type I restriction-modification enzyme R subunit C-terminal domain-containing protein, partial [Thermoanaerobaculia bacterium]